MNSLILMIKQQLFDLLFSGVFYISSTVCLLLLFVLSSSSIQAQTASYTFQNSSGKHDIDLYVNGQKKHSLERLNTESFTFDLGDEVRVKVPGNDALGWYVTHITELNPTNRVVIDPDVIWWDNDTRKLGTPIINYYYNLRGIHIHEYDPQIVSQSFKPSKIFEGIMKNTFDYKLTDKGDRIYTEGFHEQPLFKAEEKSETTFSSNSRDYKKAFQLNSGIAASVPVPKTPLSVGGGLDFGYNKTNEQRFGNDSYSWSETKRVYSYEILIDDITRVRMDPDFLNYIEDMEQTGRYNAEQFVEKFGTHFPVKIQYGAQYSKFVSMEKDDYYEAEKEGWDIGLSAKISQEGVKTETSLPAAGSLTQTVGDNTKPAGLISANLSFGEETQKSKRNLLQNTKRKAIWVGGAGVGNNWTVTPSNAVAVRVLVRRIDSLFFPYILKNDWTTATCSKWRGRIAAAAQVQIDNMPLLDNSKVKKRRFKVRVVEFTKTDESDDTDKRIRGEITLRSTTPSVQEVEGRDSISLWKEDSWQDVFAGGIIANMVQKNHKWKVFEQVSDQNGRFAPISFSAGGQLQEADIIDRVGGTLTYSDGRLFDVDFSQGSVFQHILKLEHNILGGTQRYLVDVTLEFKPSFDFENMFEGAALQTSQRSGSISTLPTVQVTRPNWTRDKASTNLESRNTKVTGGKKEESSVGKEVGSDKVSKVMFKGGSFVQQGASKTWVETDNSGKARFNYQETGRDQFSVYLHDTSRNVRIALDLWTKKVKYSGPNSTKYRDLYTITGVQ